jgi:hypothetical protein
MDISNHDCGVVLERDVSDSKIFNQDKIRLAAGILTAPLRKPKVPPLHLPNPRSHHVPVTYGPRSGHEKRRCSKK